MNKLTIEQAAAAVIAICSGWVTDKRDAFNAAITFVSYRDFTITLPSRITVRFDQEDGCSINWSACGSQSIDSTKSYMQWMQDAVSTAERIERDAASIKTLIEGLDSDALRTAIRDMYQA